MWHFASDSSNEYTGEKFEVAWEDGQSALFPIYTKDLKTCMLDEILPIYTSPTCNSANRPKNDMMQQTL